MRKEPLSELCHRSVRMLNRPYQWHICIKSRSKELGLNQVWSTVEQGRTCSVQQGVVHSTAQQERKQHTGGCSGSYRIAATQDGEESLAVVAGVHLEDPAAVSRQPKLAADFL